MSFEITRVKLQKVVAAFQLANYSTMEVNYPKKFITDVEQIKVPFVVVEWTRRKQTMGLPTTLYKIYGELLITHYARKGSGDKIFSDYSSLLDHYIARETLEGIQFHDVNPFDNAGIVGFDGTANTVNYEIQFTK
jgi:hypothetical protein